MSGCTSAEGDGTAVDMDADQLIEAGRRFAALHSSHGAPPNSIYLVGHQPSNLHDEFLGEYVLEGYHEEKPVYGLREWRCREHRHWPDAVMHVQNRSSGQAWTIGKRESMEGSHLGQLGVYDDAITPSAITGIWYVYTVEDGWVPAPALQVLTGKEGAAAAAAHERRIEAKAEAAPMRVRLQGTLPDRAGEDSVGLGEYVKVQGGLCDRRPLYESVGRGIHLRYMADQGLWFIGDESTLGYGRSCKNPGYMHVANAMAWNPAHIGVKTRRRFGDKMASTIGVWKVFTRSRSPEGNWIDAPGLELVDVDAEILDRKHKVQALITLLCIVCVALIPVGLHGGRQMFRNWQAARRAAARAQKIQDRRRQRRAVELEVLRFAKSLDARPRSISGACGGQGPAGSPCPSAQLSC